MFGYAGNPATAGTCRHVNIYGSLHGELRDGRPI
jgi:hypothetical protein